MKMERVLASLEITNILGFVAIAADFRISRGMLAPEREKIGLFVARTDNMDTSSCIITPPEANFLLNGKGVWGRADVAMDKGPQLPTDLTPMLICGTNFLQVVGNFNDYVQPSVALEDPDELDQGGLIGGVLLVSNRWKMTLDLYEKLQNGISDLVRFSLTFSVIAILWLTAQSSNSPRNTVTQNLHPLTSSHAMHIPGCSTIKQNVLLIRHQNTRGRPSGRMRGSLKGEAYTAALCRFMRQAAQPADRELPRLLPPYIVFRVRSRAVLLTSLTE
ncbi:hypothetical protein LguiA_019067 [Lonicera macranthoides]